MLKVGVSNFRNAWESMGADWERVDEYGLGPRESLAEAVSAVINLLGLQPCEVCKLFGFLQNLAVVVYICPLARAPKNRSSTYQSKIKESSNGSNDNFMFM